MTAMMSAAGGGVSGLAGTVTVAALVVVAAIIPAVMDMTSFLFTSFHRADRTARIGLRSAMTVMSMGGHRKHQKCGRE